MNSKIFIPTKIKVGFQTRSDTYTGKLGYVIYHDGKVWRKEKSWEGWRFKYIDSATFQAEKNASFQQQVKRYTDMYNTPKTQLSHYHYRDQYETIEKFLRAYRLDRIDRYQYNPYNQSEDPSIEPVEHDNVPTEGFVLNKKAGGDRYGWNPRQTYCRVYDPRGFEFEITIPNLLYILENTTSSVGKGLEGKFIYGWSGTELVLIPEKASEYKDMLKFTNIQNKSVLKSTLVKGEKYTTSDLTTVIYMDEAPAYDLYYGDCSSDKKLWFHDALSGSFTTLAIAKIKVCENDPVSNYAELFEKLENYKGYAPTKKLTYTQFTEKSLLSKFKDPGSYYNSHIQQMEVWVKNKKGNYAKNYFFYKVKKSAIFGMSNGWEVYMHKKYIYSYRIKDTDWKSLKDFLKDNVVYEKITENL
jgi:hypothetical protein